MMASGKTAELSQAQIEDIAKQVVADFCNPRLHGLARDLMTSILREQGVDPSVVKAEHLLMAHVIARVANETGGMKFKKDDIVEIFDRAAKLIGGGSGAK